MELLKFYKNGGNNTYSYYVCDYDNRRFVVSFDRSNKGWKVDIIECDLMEAELKEEKIATDINQCFNSIIDHLKKIYYKNFEYEIITQSEYTIFDHLKFLFLKIKS